MFSNFKTPLSHKTIKRNLRAIKMTTECDYKGNSLQEIYRNANPWELMHLPSIVNKRDHAVLFQLPIDPNSTTPPEPHRSELKWDSHHVRLPCAPQNEYSVFDEENRSKSEKKPRWEIIQTALLQPIRSSKELEKAILSYNTKYAKKWKFYALHELFEVELTQTETGTFFDETLPAIIRLALQLPDIVPCAIPLLKQGSNKSISLSQQQVACVLANAFLCTFPRRNEYSSHAEYNNYPTINFHSLFQIRSSDKVLEKIKCICNYFRSVCKKMPIGVLTFARRTMAESKFPDWSKCDIKFTESSMAHISANGSIEDDGQGLLQVDFANKFLGGGALDSGCVQEEIRFVICPELFCSRLFTEKLESNECLVIMGCERFNSYQGYANTFRWAGAYEDKTPADLFRRRKCTIVAIDAIYFGHKLLQFQENMLKRELNKAFVGFYHELNTPPPGVATGNWGCGAFNGDKSLKSLIQLMVCCVTNRPLVYFTFGDSELRDNFYSMFQYLKQNQVKISELWSYLNQIRKHESAVGHLYEFMIQCHKDSQAKKKSSTQCQTSTNIQSDIHLSTEPNQSGEDLLIFENSSEQMDDEEILKHIDEAESSYNLIRPKSTKNLPTIPKSKENAAKLNVTQTSKSLASIEPAIQTSDSSATIIAKLNENPEKRQRSLLDCLDENYYSETPSKMKRESNSPTKRSGCSKPNTIVSFSPNAKKSEQISINIESADEHNNSPESAGPETVDKSNTENNDKNDQSPQENEVNSDSIKEMDYGLESLHVVPQTSSANSIDECNVDSDNVIPATPPSAKSYKSDDTSQTSIFDFFKKK